MGLQFTRLGPSLTQTNKPTTILLSIRLDHLGLGLAEPNRSTTYGRSVKIQQRNRNAAFMRRFKVLLFSSSLCLFALKYIRFEIIHCISGYK